MVGIADGFSPVAIAPCPSVAGAPSACPSAPCGRLCEEVSRCAEDPAIGVLSSVPDAPHRAGGLQSQSRGGRLTASRAGTGAICAKGVARIYMWIGSTRAVWHPPANKMVNVADQFCRSALCQRLIGGRRREGAPCSQRPVGRMLLVGSHLLHELGVGGATSSSLPSKSILFLACPGEANIKLESNFSYGECCRRFLDE